MVIPGGGEQCVAAFDITERKRPEQDFKAALVEVQTLKERLEEENLYLKEEISEVKGFDEIIGKSDVLKYVLTIGQELRSQTLAERR